MQRAGRWIASLMAVSVLAAACGSSSGSKGGSGDGDQPQRSPIKLGLMTAVQTNLTSRPWTVAAARVAAAAVNAAGGIMGHPVEIDFCDDHGTPQGGAVCAQKLLVQDKVLMMAGDDGSQEPSLIPTLKAAHTISFGSMGDSLPSLKSDRVYIVDPVQTVFWILPQILPKTAKRVAYITQDDAISESAYKAALAYYPKSIDVHRVTAALDATSMQRTCLEIKDSGADTAVVAIKDTLIAPLVQDCDQLGLKHLTYAFASVVFSPEAVKTLSELHQPNVVGMSFSQATVDGLAADNAKYGPKVGRVTNTIADDAVNAWLAVKLVAKIIPQVGSTDATKIKAWLDRQTTFDTMGATAPIDFTKTPVKTLPRLKNASVRKGEVKGDELVVTDPKPLTLRPSG